jgi:hypothetical protein
MPVVLLLTAVAVLAGVVVVAVGRGGELASFRSDAPPLRYEFASAADLAMFRPPPAFFGYSAQATDDALRRIARLVSDRDAELATLRSQLAALRARPGDAAGPAAARAWAPSAPSAPAEDPADQPGESAEPDAGGAGQ